MSAGKRNAYRCRDCGRYTVTLDVDDGVTPYMLACRADGPDVTVGCQGMGESMFYPVEPWPAHDEQDVEIPSTPTFHWYAPDARERKALSKKARQRGGQHEQAWDHVRRGGLLLRPV